MHDLTGRTLQQLAVLDGSQYTVVPGSRASLKCLSTAVEAACLAALDLAEAVADNPLDATGFSGEPLPDAAARQAQDAKTRARLADIVADAAHQLDVCATGCQYAASGIIRDLIRHPQHMPPMPQLTRGQYTALETIAQDGARLWRSLRGGRETIRAGNGSTIRSKPFHVLAKNRLVRVQERDSSLGGQDVSVTAAGQLVLDTQRSSRTPPSAPARPAPSASSTAGRRR
ncbi:hypothetical protein [Streptomyces rubradiris]|uniref:Uncharacterized protein n=1 Tax=Streptomyces rubradiris TaxID=285531 RepID=A0ABQ3RDR2_STRRR|nr:hypothetical protein [Streptomyces rubradiris]GHH29433.1 hypothetical protein GCM10018792_74510 [Streptomyces rubradiris]GHI53989.1 hypothetical protein Srubr_38350 [Streptomyces rubradiris]